MSAKTRFLTILCLLLAVALGPAQPTQAATIFYVDPNGTDAPGRGTAALPWRTLTYAVDQTQVQPGDTIHLNAGTYSLARTAHVRPGITIEGAGRTKTTITGSGFYSGLLRFASEQYSDGNQALRDLRIEGQNRAQESGVIVQGRHNFKLYRVDFANFSHTAFDITADGYARGNSQNTVAPSVYLRGFEAYDFTVSNSGSNYGWLSGAFQVGGVDGALIHNFVIENSTAQAYGLKFAAGGWFKNTKIYNGSITAHTNVTGDWAGMAASIEFWNVLEGNEVHDLTVNTWMSFVDQTNEQEQSTSLKVYNNIFNLPEACEPNVTCIKYKVASIELAVSNAEIYNNYFKNPGVFGVAVWSGAAETEMGPRTNNTIYNNVFERVGSLRDDINDHTAVHIQASYIDGVKIYNNTGYRVGGARIQESAVGTYVRNVEFKNNLFLNPTAVGLR